MIWKGYAHYTPKYSRRKKFNWLAFCFLITAETAGVDKIPSLHLKEKEIINVYYYLRISNCALNNNSYTNPTKLF